MKIFSDSFATVSYIKELSGNSPNLNITKNRIGNVNFHVIVFENMTDGKLLTEGVINFMQYCEKHPVMSGNELFNLLYEGAFVTSEKKDLDSMEALYTAICSGFAVFVIDGVPKALKLGVQGYQVRSIGEPTENAQIMGSKESFTESVKTNQTMIRRRMKSQNLRIDELQLGSESNTICSIVYMKNHADSKMIDEIREKISNSKIEVILESGAIKMIVDEKHSVLFSQAVPIERPDAMCRLINDGRVGILVDGTPFAVVVPYLMKDHFQTLDDYSYKTGYANIIRALRYIAYLVALLGSGLFVALVKFHPYLLPSGWLEKINGGIADTPFSVFGEMMVILIIYEIMREAGLRLPKEIGHTISIVGSLIIGDAAVSGGLLSSGVVLIAALTSVATYIVPTLIDSTVPVRFIFTLAAGFFGFYGMGVVLAIYLFLLIKKKAYGMRYASGLFGDIKKVRTSYASEDE